MTRKEPPAERGVRVLVSARRIARRTAELGRAISARLRTARRAGDPPVAVVVVLKGAFMFAADLARHLSVPCEIEFVSARSYRGKKRGGLRVAPFRWETLRGRDVLVVDGVFDSGATLRAIAERAKRAGSRRVLVCALLRKKRPSRTRTRLDFTGFEVPDEFVVGYGMDENGRNRELPYVGVRAVRKPGVRRRGDARAGARSRAGRD